MARVMARVGVGVGAKVWVRARVGAGVRARVGAGVRARSRAKVMVRIDGLALEVEHLEHVAVDELLGQRVGEQVVGDVDRVELAQPAHLRRQASLEEVVVEREHL